MINKIIFSEIEKGSKYSYRYGETDIEAEVFVENDINSLLEALGQLINSHDIHNVHGVVSNLHLFSDGEKFGMLMVPIDGLPKATILDEYH